MNHTGQHAFSMSDDATQPCSLANNCESEGFRRCEAMDWIRCAARVRNSFSKTFDFSHCPVRSILCSVTFASDGAIFQLVDYSQKLLHCCLRTVEIQHHQLLLEVLITTCRLQSIYQSVGIASHSLFLYYVAIARTSKSYMLLFHWDRRLNWSPQCQADMLPQIWLLTRKELCFVNFEGLIRT